MDPPKLITLQAPTVRTQRTLIWLRSQDPSVPWRRWDGVVVGLDAYRRWKSAGTARIVCLIVTELSGAKAEADEELAELYHAAKDVTLVLLSDRVVRRKSEEFWKENFDNVLNLEEWSETYPFLAPAWNGSAEDAVWMTAIFCRYSRVVDGPHEGMESRAAVDQEIVRVWNLRPPPLWLVTQWYSPASKARRHELRTCLERNVACPWVDRVVLLHESAATIGGLPHVTDPTKIHSQNIGRRLRYSDFLRYVQSDEVPRDTMVALCNADIYVDEEMAELWKVDLSGRLLALLRWDDVGHGPTDPSTALFGPRADSQDTWIVWSTTVKDHAEKTWSAADFFLGQPGCDNAFAGVMMRNRFLLTNPAMSVKTYHLHNSKVRTYHASDTIRSPLYINLVPTYLTDTRQEIVPKGSPRCICNELVAFEVKSSSLSNEITYCTMLEKEGRYKWEPQVENHLFEPAIPVYSWKNAAVTPNGLVYDLHRIYTGRHAMAEERYNYWKDSMVDLFTPLHSRPMMIALPLADPARIFGATLDHYLVFYFSHVLRILQEYPGAAFWIPVGAGPTLLEGYASAAGITAEQMVAWEGMKGCWADQVVGFLPGPATTEVSREGIAALRLARSAAFAESNPVCVVCTDDSICTEEFVNTMLRPLIEKTPGWTVRCISARGRSEEEQRILRDASVYVHLGGKEKCDPRVWMLSPHTKVVEFQQELKMDGEMYHLCVMAELCPWILLLSKGTTVDVQDQIATQLRKWWAKHI